MGGGNSGISDAFFEHLPIEDACGFALTYRFSPIAMRQTGVTQTQLDEAVRKGQLITYPDSTIYREASAREVVPKKPPIFTGKVYVLTDTTSFSSAVYTATWLNDNDLATVVGEPTGGMPTSYGDYLEFTTPELDLPLRVSRKYFVRSDPSRDPADTLTPDIPLPVTVKDVQTGQSPITAWLEGLARASAMKF